MYKAKPLPYDYDALEPVISATTVNIHYNRHYKNYLNKLNKLLENVKYDKNYEVKDIIINIDKFPIELRGDILFNAGGVINHELYFYSMNPVSNRPIGKLGSKINEKFGSYDNFKTKFIEEANKVVGSGYTFLVMDGSDLKIINTSNQESPYSYGFIPLLTIDLWEHAYYLDYQNVRGDYINNFFSIINFNEAEKIYESNI